VLFRGLGASEPSHIERLKVLFEGGTFLDENSAEFKGGLGGEAPRVFWMWDLHCPTSSEFFN